MQDLVLRNKLAPFCIEAASIIEEQVWFEYASQAGVLIFERKNILPMEDLRRVELPSTENLVSWLMWGCYDDLTEALEDNIEAFKQEFGEDFTEFFLIESAIDFIFENERLASVERHPQREVW